MCPKQAKSDSAKIKRTAKKTLRLKSATDAHDKSSLKVPNQSGAVSDEESPLDYVTQGQIPTVFARRLRRAWKDDPSWRDAVNWYTKRLVTTDVKGSPVSELSHLESILRNDHRYNTRSGRGRSGWMPIKHLGQGGWGSVVLWEREMGNGQPPAQVACKDTAFDPWFEDYNSEAQLTRRVYAAGCRNVIKVIDWLPNPRRKYTRIISEYCRHGSLLNVWNFYEKNQMVTVPEAFLWHIFHSMATAICYNTHGSTNGITRPGWIPIVHRDIKPLNILVDEPDMHSRRLYPTIKLADYGAAYSIPNDAVRKMKRAWNRGGGTWPYTAPEGTPEIRHDPYQTPNPIVSPQTDIYSLGCVILDFIRITWEKRYIADERSNLDLDLPYAYEFFPFSKDLVDLVRQCVKADSKLRPTPKELFDRTQKHADSSYAPLCSTESLTTRHRWDVHPGIAMWNFEIQARYRTSPVFRDAVTQLDWFSQHKSEMARLRVAVVETSMEMRPPEGQVAIGLGLGGFTSLDSLFEDYHRQPMETWLMEASAFSPGGTEYTGPKNSPFLSLMAPDRLCTAPLEEGWEEREHHIDQYPRRHAIVKSHLARLKKRIADYTQRAEDVQGVPVNESEAVPPYLIAMRNFQERVLRSMEEEEELFEPGKTFRDKDLYGIEPEPDPIDSNGNPRIKTGQRDDSSRLRRRRRSTAFGSESDGTGDKANKKNKANEKDKANEKGKAKEKDKAGEKDTAGDGGIAQHSRNKQEAPSVGAGPAGEGKRRQSFSDSDKPRKRKRPEASKTR